MKPGTAFVIGLGSGVLGVWIVAKALRSTLETSITTQVENQIVTSASSIFPPGTDLNALRPQIRVTVAQPVAKGVLDGLML